MYQPKADCKQITNHHSLPKKGQLCISKSDSKASLIDRHSMSTLSLERNGLLKISPGSQTCHGSNVFQVQHKSSCNPARGRRVSLGTFRTGSQTDIQQLIRDLKITPSNQSSFTDEKSTMINEQQLDPSNNKDPQLIFNDNMTAIKHISNHLKSLKQNSLITDQAQTISMLLQSISKKISHAKNSSESLKVSKNRLIGHLDTNELMTEPPSYILKISSMPESLLTTHCINFGALGAPVVHAKDINIGNDKQNISFYGHSECRKIHNCSLIERQVCEVSPIKQLISEQTSSRIIYTNFSIKDLEQQNMSQSREDSQLSNTNFSHKKQVSNTPTAFTTIQTPQNKSLLVHGESINNRILYIQSQLQLQRSHQTSKNELSSHTKIAFQAEQDQIEQLNEEIKSLQKLLREKTKQGYCNVSSQEIKKPPSPANHTPFKKQNNRWHKNKIY